MDLTPKADKAITTLILGSSGSGKSNFIEYTIFENQDKFEYVLIFSSSGTQDGDYLGCTPLVVTNTAKVNIEWHLKFQKKMHENFKAGKLKKRPFALWIFDDILDSDIKLKGTDEKFWRGLLSTCRHNDVTVIFSIQAGNNVMAPSIRSQINRVVLFRTAIKPEVILDMLPPIEKDGKMVKPNEFKLLMAQTMKEPHTALFFDLEKGVYGKKVKAPRKIPFRFKYIINEESSSEESDDESEESEESNSDEK
jgi:hypothetical protein